MPTAEDTQLRDFPFHQPFVSYTRSFYHKALQERLRAAAAGVIDVAPKHTITHTLGEAAATVAQDY